MASMEGAPIPEDKPENKKGGQPQNMSRRQFLKRAGVVGAAAAASAVIPGILKVGMMIDESERAEKIKNALDGVGIITKKEKLPGTPVMVVNNMTMPPLPGPRRIYIAINGKEGYIDVSYDEYESYNVGDSVKIKYDTEDSPENIDVLTIEKTN